MALDITTITPLTVTLYEDVDTRYMTPEEEMYFDKLADDILDIGRLGLDKGIQAQNLTSVQSKLSSIIKTIDSLENRGMVKEYMSPKDGVRINRVAALKKSYQQLSLAIAKVQEIAKIMEPVGIPVGIQQFPGKMYGARIPNPNPSNLRGGIVFSPQGLSGSSVASTAIHELIHYIEAKFSKIIKSDPKYKGGSQAAALFWEIQRNLELVSSEVVYAEKKRMRNLGFSDEESEKFSRYWGDPSEMLARTMAEYIRGETLSIPDLGETMDRFWKLIPDDYKNILSKLSAIKTVKQDVESFGIEIDDDPIVINSLMKKLGISVAESGVHYEMASPSINRNMIRDALIKKAEEKGIQVINERLEKAIDAIIKSIESGSGTGYGAEYVYLGGESNTRIKKIFNDLREKVQQSAVTTVQNVATATAATVNGQTVPVLSVDEDPAITLARQGAMQSAQDDEIKKSMEGINPFRDFDVIARLQREAVTLKQKGIEQQVIINEYLEQQNKIDAVKAAKIQEQNLVANKKQQDIARRYLAGMYDEGDVIGYLAQSRGGQREVGQKAFDVAGQHGFSSENLKKVYTNLPENTSFLEFQKSVDGVMQKATVVVNKYGEVLVKTRRDLLGFTDSIVKNTREVLRWSIGVGIVYGTMYKLQELVRLAIDNEAKLADITVVLGDAQRDLTSIFNDAANVAQQTGENINGVLEAYTMAYRAVGEIVDPIERNIAANRILYESTVLTKLSTLSYADAIDVLSGSIQQLRGPNETMAEGLDRGAELLDKWVYLTTVANVDLDTLATAFSITGESATNAFADVEEGVNFTNAAIAVLSSKLGALGEKQTGNAVRAIIAGFSTDQSKQKLNEFGISVEDINGKLRNWADISLEIYQRYKTGLISTEGINDISLAIGGGSRNQSRVAAYLTGMGDVLRLTKEQSDETLVAGTAQEALGRKMDIVKTSVTSLGNSFQSLAQTLGDEGGILDVSKLLIGFLTNMTTGIDGLAKSMKTLTIPAALLLLSKGLFSGSSGSLRYSDMSNRLGSSVGGMLTGLLSINPAWRDKRAGMVYGSDGMYQSYTPGVASSAGQRFGGAAGKYGVNALTGLSIAAFPAMAHVGQGDYKSAGVDIGAAIVGQLMLAGNPLGALIGVAVAEAFMSALQSTSTAQDVFGNIYKDVIKEGVEDQKENPLIEAAYKRMGADTLMNKPELYALAKLFGLEGVGRVAAKGVELGSSVRSGIAGFFGKKTPAVNMAQVATANYLTPDEMRQLRGEFMPEEVTELTTSSAQFTKQAGIAKEISPDIELYKQQRKQQLLEELIKGSITRKEYTTQTGNLLTLGEKASAILAVMKGKYDELSDSVRGSTEEQEALIDIMAKAPAEVLPEISSLVREYQLLAENIDNAKSIGNESLTVDGKILSVKEAENRQLEVQIQLYNLLLLAQEQANKVTLPDILGTPLSSEQDISKIMPYYDKLLNAFFEGLTPDEKAKKEQELKMAKALVEIMQGGVTTAFARLEGVDSGLWAKATDWATKEGAISQSSTSSLGFQQFDVSQSQLMAAISQANALATQWQSQFGYTPDQEELIAITNDDLVSKLKSDWKIVQYLLGRIEKNTKDISGVFNLPEGASFWFNNEIIPFLKAGAGGGGIPSATPEEVPQSKWTPELVDKMTKLAAMGSVGADEEAYEKYTAERAKETTEKKEKQPWESYGENNTKIPEGRTESGRTSAGDKRDTYEELKAAGYVRDSNGRWRKAGPHWSEEQQEQKPAGVIDTLINWLKGLTGSNEQAGAIRGASQGGAPMAGAIRGASQGGAPMANASNLEMAAAAGMGNIPDTNSLIDSAVNAAIGGLQGGGSSMRGRMNDTAPQVDASSVSGTQDMSKLFEKLNTTINFKLNLTSHTQLIVDGRTLANIIKPYLSDDLLRSDTSVSTFSKNTVI